MLKRTLPITLLLALVSAPAGAAMPQAHTAAEQRAEVTLEEAQELLEGRGVRTGREATHALRELAAHVRHLRGDERKQAVALLSRPTDADAPDDERYTVPELPPLCDANFCIHSVGTGDDAASADMAALALLEADAVREFENDTLGWREPPDDGDGRVDIYLKDLGAERLFGFASTDPGQSKLKQHSYLVIDNDFDPAQYNGTDPLESLRLTLAHEYAHVLQYGYDVLADPWHFESSAMWMEERMYPEIKDWLRFLLDRPTGEGWSSLTELSLTYFEAEPDDDGALDPRWAKAYGGTVWNQFLSSKYGPDGDALQRATWERSKGDRAASTDAFHAAIRAAGGRGIAPDFAEFSAAVAEWQVPAAPFPTPSELPDVERRGELIRDGAVARLMMDHLSFAFYDVPPTDGPIRFAATFPDGLSAAVALVARQGAAADGQVTTELLELPDGGSGGVTIDDTTPFFASGGRVTAVLVNSDTSYDSFDNETGDWAWVREDQLVAARLSSDTSEPRARLQRFRLGSRDADRLTFEARLRQGGRVVSRSSGGIRPGAVRRLRMTGGERGRAKLIVRLTDPAANTRRLERAVRLGA